MHHFNHAHNLFVERLNDLGILGLIPFLAIFSLPFYQYNKLQNKFSLLPYLIICIVYPILASFYGVIYSSFNSFSGATIFWIMAMSRINHAFQIQDQDRLKKILLPNYLLILAFLVCLVYSGMKIIKNHHFLSYRSALQSGQIQEAETHLVRSYSKLFYPYYGYHRSTANMISKYYAGKDLKKSILWAEQALKDQPHNLAYKLHLAKLYTKNNNYRGAKKLYQEVISSNYTIIEAYLGRAEIAIIQKNNLVYKKNMNICKEYILGLKRMKKDSQQKEYLYFNEDRFWVNLEKLEKQMIDLEEQFLNIEK